MDRPIADNRTQSGRGRNRRTEFRLVNPGER
jgi:outer membrane protein OmpA-like peptidoglycan-associated protein